jgi:hypothetical protein
MFGRLFALCLPLLLCAAQAQPLVRTDIQYCKGSLYKLFLNCTDPKFSPQAACAYYTPDSTAVCDGVPIFNSADGAFRLVFFSSSNTDISAWANGLNYVGLMSNSAAIATSAARCAFGNALALKGIELTTNASNFAETLLSSPFGFTRFDSDAGASVDAGIKEVCYAPATPPSPPPLPPPPAPPLINGSYELHCDPSAQKISLSGCRSDLPSEIPAGICTTYMLTADYIPSTCFGVPIYQSVSNPSIFMWWVDKSLTDNINSYYLVGDGKSLCTYASGFLALKIPVYTARYNWLQAVKMSQNFTFYNSTSASDQLSGASVVCLNFVVAYSPPPLPPPSPPGYVAPPPLPPGSAQPGSMPPPLPPGWAPPGNTQSPPPGNSTSGSLGSGTAPSKSMLIGIVVGTSFAVVFAVGGVYVLFGKPRKREKKVLVTPESTRRFLF